MVFPIAVFVAIAIALAVSVQGLAIYLGTLLSVWLMFAYALPLLTGVMSSGERSGQHQSSQEARKPLRGRTAG